ncbi:MAG: LysR substrate-binding domain-containing protein, partial [Cyanobacteria bacterium J06576_12]
SIEFADDNKFPYSKVRSNITVNSVNAIRELVKDGLGIHLGPAWVFKVALEKGEICQILPKYTLKSFPVRAVYVNRAYLPRKTEAFIQQLSEYLKTTL